MAKVIAYEYELRGVKRAITNQAELTQAVKDTNKELQNTTRGTDQYKKLDKQLATLKNSQQGIRDEQKRTRLALVAAAEKGTGSYRELNATLKLLESQFQDLSRQGRKTAEGLQIADRIKEIRKEIRGINEEQGKTGIRGALSDALGDLGGFNIAQFATIGGAISAGAAAAGQAVQFVSELVPRFRELRGEIELLTGETGEQLDTITSRVDAISRTFGEGTDRIVESANAVSKNLGISFEEALDRIQEGFVAGSNATDEFLDSVREYPTFAKEAELSADAFFKIINRQATEGIYSDKGIDAVKEATIRLRELPKATLAAL